MFCAVCVFAVFFVLLPAGGWRLCCSRDLHCGAILVEATTIEGQDTTVPDVDTKLTHILRTNKQLGISIGKLTYTFSVVLPCITAVCREPHRRAVCQGSPCCAVVRHAWYDIVPGTKYNTMIYQYSCSGRYFDALLIHVLGCNVCWCSVVLIFWCFGESMPHTTCQVVCWFLFC